MFKPLIQPRSRLLFKSKTRLKVCKYGINFQTALAKGGRASVFNIKSKTVYNCPNFFIFWTYIVHSSFSSLRYCGYNQCGLWISKFRRLAHLVDVTRQKAELAESNNLSKIKNLPKPDQLIFEI